MIFPLKKNPLPLHPPSSMNQWWVGTSNIGPIQSYIYFFPIESENCWMMTSHENFYTQIANQEKQTPTQIFSHDIS